MKRSVEGADRAQSTFLPGWLDEWVDEDSAVRAIEAFGDELGLAEMGSVSSSQRRAGPRVIPRSY